MRPPDDLDVDPFRPTGACDLVDRGAESVGFDREGLLRCQDDLVGVDRTCRDERAFEHAVRIVAEDRAVLECPRFAFGRVHHDRRSLELRAVVPHRAPLATRGEPGAPAAAETGGVDLRDDLIGAEPSRSLQPAATMCRGILVELAERDEVTRVLHQPLGHFDLARDELRIQHAERDEQRKGR